MSVSADPIDGIQPRIFPRSEHGISRARLSENALKVLYRLKTAGYDSYLVGGGVRDLLLGCEPKDFDVATDALPEEVRAEFRNCRLIGRRFRLAHVYFGAEIVEVATFRAGSNGERAESVDSDSTDHVQGEDGRILKDNLFGTIEDDAFRRDFTINALYYNIADFSVVDYVGGMEDLLARRLRMIGDPEVRFREDPVRMLRAVRFAAKLGFRIEAEVEHWILELGHLLQDIPPARLFDETLKLFLGGQSLATFELLRHYDLFRHLFPMSDRLLGSEANSIPSSFLPLALRNSDQRVAEGKAVSPAFLYACLLWEPVAERAADYEARRGLGGIAALQEAGHDLMGEQVQHTSIPKRFSLSTREIWSMQPRFEQRTGKRGERLMSSQRFRTAYDFLTLRAQAGDGEAEELRHWWGKLIELPSEEQKQRFSAKRPRRKSAANKGAA